MLHSVYIVQDEFEAVSRLKTPAPVSVYIVNGITYKLPGLFEHREMTPAFNGCRPPNAKVIIQRWCNIAEVIKPIV